MVFVKTNLLGMYKSIAVFMLPVFLLFSLPSTMPYKFVTTQVLSMPVPGVKCPTCLKEGRTVWVIPGKNCPACGTPCAKTMTTVGVSILIFSLVGLSIYTTGDTLHIQNIDYSDAPRPWGLYFQDSASPQMESIIEFHDIVLFNLLWVFNIVSLMMYIIKSKYIKTIISNKYVAHGISVELIWTIAPGWMLTFISFASYNLLYIIDEVNDINITFNVEGHQWYWSYQYPDFLANDDNFIEFDSYLTPDPDLQGGNFRMLDVDNKVILPEVTNTRFLVSSGDVIHSYACPSLAIKADAYPGRLNQASTLINRLGTFFGQCSEICGTLHSGMPIAIQSITLEKFLIFLLEK